MLQALHIENFAIVKSLALEFAEGMTVFTGETGAGKSIIIDALMLALGARADGTVIRPGAQKCDITAVFHIDETGEPAQWLKLHDLLEGDTVILRRVLTQDGRSRAYINTHPFPLQKIKAFTDKLVHLHGQHEHYALMQAATHREQLDQYGNHRDLLSRVGKHYQACQTLEKEIEALTHSAQQADRISLLSFQIEELKSLDLKTDEMRMLDEEHQRLHQAYDNLQTATDIIERLQSDADKPSVIRHLHDILPKLNRPIYANVRTTLESALIQCEEALHDIEKVCRDILIDPERLAFIESRLSTLHHMARKYHVEPNQLQGHLALLEKTLQSLKDNDKKLADYQAQLVLEKVDYEKAAKALSDARQKAALPMASAIMAIIQQLGMPHAVFKVQLTQYSAPHPYGSDQVTYYIATNPGMPLDSLHKIASGGELARVGLAIQMVTAQRGTTPTLLFDEVDVGIGGSTAALVGQLLRQLGDKLQVFCVTHQPQVASSAHHHFVVEKYTQEGQTYSAISHLDNTDKVSEIARMLGGLEMTPESKSHAEKLLADSQLA